MSQWISGAWCFETIAQAFAIVVLLQGPWRKTGRGFLAYLLCGEVLNLALMAIPTSNYTRAWAIGLPFLLLLRSWAVLDVLQGALQSLKVSESRRRTIASFLQGTSFVFGLVALFLEVVNICQPAFWLSAAFRLSRFVTAMNIMLLLLISGGLRLLGIRQTQREETHRWLLSLYFVGPLLAAIIISPIHHLWLTLFELLSQAFACLCWASLLQKAPHPSLSQCKLGLDSPDILTDFQTVRELREVQPKD